MSQTAALKLLLVINSRWLHSDVAVEKKIRVKNCLQLSDRRSRITVSARDVALRFRDYSGSIQLDPDAHLTVSETNGEVLLHSHHLASDLLRRMERDELLFVHIEQVQEIARIQVFFLERAKLEALNDDRPDLRLATYDLPPPCVTEVEPAGSGDVAAKEDLYSELRSYLQALDPVLVSAQAEQFLRTPHIVVPLLTHIAGLNGDDTLRFPIQIKRLADQFRVILASQDSPVRIHKIERNHLETWAAVQGKRYAFLDGGFARIAGLPGTAPTAIRVGIYSVSPGDESLVSRERWKLLPYIVGDIIDKETGVRMNGNKSTSGV